MALLPRVVAAAPVVQTFGPGQVSCQQLSGAHMDCLLTANRITDRDNVVSFDLSLLAPRDQALFRRWCLAGTDACVVTLTGRQASPRSTQLAAVLSVHWTRLSMPGNGAATHAGAGLFPAHPR